MTKPQLTVVLCTFNSEATVGQQLDALARQEWNHPWEVVISDNGSTDETLTIVESYRGRLPGLRIVDSSDKRGLGHACNAGAAAAESDAIAFCNDDDEVGEGWLAAMGDALMRHELVGGALEHERLNEGWATLVRGTPQSVELPRWRGVYLPFAFGCTIGVRAELHHRIGGFDEGMLPAAEDMDYCWRAQAAGATLHFVPQAQTHYRLRTSLSEIYRQARNYAEADVLLYKKHQPVGLPKIEHPLSGTLKGWLRVFAPLVTARGRARLALVAWRLGWVVGLVRGSVRHRVFYLAPG